MPWKFFFLVPCIREASPQNNIAKSRRIVVYAISYPLSVTGALRRALQQERQVCKNCLDGEKGKKVADKLRGLEGPWQRQSDREEWLTDWEGCSAGDEWDGSLVYLDEIEHGLVYVLNHQYLLRLVLVYGVSMAVSRERKSF